MTLPELAQKLNAIYPTRYSHFKTAQAPPFICYIDDGSDNFSADNTIFHEVESVSIELYTANKDLAAEKKIKDFLKQNNLPYEKSPTVHIESEGVFQSVFTITLI